MSREFVLQQMASAKPVGGGLICFDSDYNYYQLGVCGYLLMYRQRRFRNDGRRCFYLTEQLAKALCFDSLFEMRFFLRSLQFWRGFVSVERLRVAFQRYDNKWSNQMI